MKEKLDRLREALTSTVIGSEDAAFHLLAALIGGGHVLIQGAPGIGKTTLAKTLARLIDGSFRRIQFTPDLLPSDILGYSVFNQGSGGFEFVNGPVFSNLVLADEINRTSPRIQSALLECMNEGQVSIDGVTRPLAAPFLVIATQNNRYAAGTFPLPEPQLDRFLLSIEMTLPDAAHQADILKWHASGGGSNGSGPERVVAAAEVCEWQRTVKRLPVSDPVCRYIVALCEGVRTHPGLRNGVSARASIALMRAAQAFACLRGHEAVFPDDVKSAAAPVLAHRLTPADDEPGLTPELPRRGRVVAVLGELLEEVAVP
ncbi:MAG: MoxR family ATPase [Verrucomicrobiae bacterium]|nr:MoxR family ATPase [Verrucomicrobiae bacterium]MCP5540438.1 MoxR family ATPase [Akkermansiaceae bacterium]